MKSKYGLSLLLITYLIFTFHTVDGAPKGRGNGNKNSGGGNNKKSDPTTTAAAPVAAEENESANGKGNEKAQGGHETRSSKTDKDPKGHREVTGDEALEKIKKSKQKTKVDKVEKFNKKLPSGFEKPKKEKLSQEDKEKLKSNCGKKSGGCNKQSEKAKAKKAEVFNRLVAAKTGALKRKAGKEKKAAAGGKGSTKELAQNVEITGDQQAEIEAEISAQMDAIFEAKKALLKAENITEDEVVPDDDGLWQGDLVLTVAQANRAKERALLGDQDLSEPPMLPEDVILGLESNQTNGETKTRKKRWSLYLEAEGGALWTKFPIKYYLDDYFSENQRMVFRHALSDIMNKTCVTFEEVLDIPDEPYIFYFKETSGTSCGSSNIGRTGDENYVWINFSSFCVDKIYGTIIHETMHALGVEHQHTRYDRNAFVAVLFDNIDPQAFDNFAVADTDAFTSYGLPYDVFSIMHYGPDVGLLIDPDATQPQQSFIAAKEPRDFFTAVLGQRKGLSGRDAEMIRKMYCMNDCSDFNVWCGWWATSGYCDSKVDLMIRLCPMSCEFCPNSVLDDVKALL